MGQVPAIDIPGVLSQLNRFFPKLFSWIILSQQQNETRTSSLKCNSTTACKLLSVFSVYLTFKSLHFYPFQTLISKTSSSPFLCKIYLLATCLEKKLSKRNSHINFPRLRFTPKGGKNLH